MIEKETRQGIEYNKVILKYLIQILFKNKALKLRIIKKIQTI